MVVGQRRAVCFTVARFLFCAGISGKQPKFAQTFTMSPSETYSSLVQKMQEVADLRYASAVLQWDQETYMPPAGAATRARQVATLTELAHAKFVSAEISDLLEQLGAGDGLQEDEKHNLRLIKEDVTKSRKLPGSFVRQMSETISRSFNQWMSARKENNFSLFAAPLAEVVELKKQEADLLGYEGHRYNALLNDYEKGATVTMLDAAFSQLKQPLRELIDRIGKAPQVDDSFLHKNYPKQEQWDYGMNLLKEMNYDLEAGRQDIAEHPFSINFSARDVRITTRVDEHDLGNMVWSTIHELGHALYEQGLPETQYGLPLGEAASLSIHESQSRMWENNVARGLSFWKHQYPRLQQAFPQQLAGVDLPHFYKGINQVKPSFIRTEADELTYHFHVMIRYELEKELIGGTLAVKDIPAFWNEQYKNWLGVIVENDRSGCLQDVHWSHGSFGYFPTYSLGSLYAAQFYRKAAQDMPQLEAQLAQGNTLPLLEWLRTNIHRHGRKYTSNELCTLVTGEPLNSAHFMDYVTRKYESIYLLT